VTVALFAARARSSNPSELYPQPSLKMLRSGRIEVQMDPEEPDQLQQDRYGA
jgi:hypothetical protein